MKKYIVLFLLAGATFTALSCKKSSGPSTPAGDIVGNWVITKRYVDTIGNGNLSTAVLDSNSSFPSQVYQFHSNGSYVPPTNPLGTLTGPLKWSLINNNSCLVITDSVAGSVSRTYQEIWTLTPSTLVLIDTVILDTGLNTQWVFYKKQ